MAFPSRRDGGIHSFTLSPVRMARCEPINQKRPNTSYATYYRASLQRIRHPSWICFSAPPPTYLKSAPPDASLSRGAHGNMARMGRRLFRPPDSTQSIPGFLGCNSTYFPRNNHPVVLLHTSSPPIHPVISSHLGNLAANKDKTRQYSVKPSIHALPHH